MDEGEPAARPREGERAAWMAAAQKGDAAAYEALLLSLLPVLRRFVRRRGVTDDEAEDVVQAILLLLHRARHTWRADRPFEPWLWAIARNASTDALRRRARERMRRVPLAEELAEVAEPGAAVPGQDPEQQLAERQLSPRLARALGRLPAAQRQAVELLYVEQLSVREAAARVGVSQTALKVRAHRGSRALRAELRSEEEA
jgi:RNA polymerase sigma factor (sigma-70 family)